MNSSSTRVDMILLTASYSALMTVTISRVRFYVFITRALKMSWSETILLNLRMMAPVSSSKYSTLVANSLMFLFTYSRHASRACYCSSCPLASSSSTFFTFSGSKVVLMCSVMAFTEATSWFMMTFISSWLSRSYSSRRVVMFI